MAERVAGNAPYDQCDLFRNRIRPMTHDPLTHLPRHATECKPTICRQATSESFCATLWRDFLAVSNLKRTHPLQNPMFHKSSTSFILSAMAFCDLSMVNIILLSLWISFRFNIDIRTITSFGCKFHMVLTYYSHMVCEFSWNWFRTRGITTLERKKFSLKQSVTATRPMSHN